ncbi:MAG TPA: hypothetical protein VFL92_03580 [Sphingomonas sp.]|nr:hypothetical protein [Sphingomonas sp.]
MAATLGQPKAQASLTSGLLARKGQARPAMRPQGFSGFGNPAGAMDDLGWNDMGAAELPPMPIAEPAVLREREALKAEIETPRPQPAPEPVVESRPAMTGAALRRIGGQLRAKQAKAKSAFTLRLDADRHLRLRLATAVCDRSAQQLVTEALDAFLATLPEVEDLARSLPAKSRKFRGK